ncbi:DUF559 domain-containing protein [Dermacoccaceae bacterium W4C1]
MSAVALALAQCGGQARHCELLTLVTRRQIRAAVESGELLRLRRGLYALAGLGEEERAAAAVGGVLSHRSAAIRHGWSVRSAPTHPEVIIPRRSGRADGRRVRLRWRDLQPQDITGSRTSPLRTVVDCARDLPLAEALSVADSALRSGAVGPHELIGALTTLPRTGRARAEVVLEQADARAANPFESSLRAIALEAVGPVFVPQRRIELSGWVVRPDLVDPIARVVLEADSHEFHTSRTQIARDCRRYNELMMTGWTVLRFAWEHVMFEPDWVARAITTARSRGSSIWPGAPKSGMLGRPGAASAAGS